MSRRRRPPSRRHRPPAPDATVANAAQPTSGFRRVLLRLLPYALLATGLAVYLSTESVPDAPWVGSGTFLLFVALAEAYRALVPRLGPLTALAAVAAGSGVVGGFFALAGWACTSGSCTTEEVGAATVAGLLVPVTLWVMFAPPVMALRLVRRLFAARAAARGAGLLRLRRTPSNASRGGSDRGSGKSSDHRTRPAGGAAGRCRRHRRSPLRRRTR